MARVPTSSSIGASNTRVITFQRQGLAKKMSWPAKLADALRQTHELHRMLSNGMAESIVKTIKRDYVAFIPKPNAATAARNLAIAFDALLSSQ